MSYKYRAQVYRESTLLWSNSWFCREFALRDIYNQVAHRRWERQCLSIRLEGLNMRHRDSAEQDGMAKFAKVLLPDHVTSADSKGIWIDTLMNEEGCQINLPKEIYSLMFFYIKYLSIQMKDRVDFERVCKSLIKRKHQVFRNTPEQQLGTALYFFAYVRHPEEMSKFEALLSSGNGPGTAMRCLSNLEEKEVGSLVGAARFYRAVLEDWCSLFNEELRYIVDYHTRTYERMWYMPLLVQDVYNKVYDGDGRFDNIEYGDDEW